MKPISVKNLEMVKATTTIGRSRSGNLSSLKLFSSEEAWSAKRIITNTTRGATQEQENEKGKQIKRLERKPKGMTHPDRI